MTNDVLALVVGIDSYDEKGWCLHGPSNSALAVIDWLLSACVQPKRISLFVGLLNDAPVAQSQKLDELKAKGVRVTTSATFQEIDNFYRKDLREASNAGARLFVYWSGHGFARPDRTRFFICQDFTVSKLNNRAINATQLINHIGSNDYRGISECIFLADVCAEIRNIDIDADIKPPNSLARNRPLVAYFGSRIGEYAKADIGGGVFTGDALVVLRKFQEWPDLKKFSAAMRAAFDGKDHATYEVGGTDSLGEFECHTSSTNDVLSYSAVPDGVHRQEVLANLLRAWRPGRRNAALLTGFAGVGKSDRVARSLMTHTSKLKAPGIYISVPVHPINLDEELLSRLVTDLDKMLMSQLVDELQDENTEALLEAVKSKSGFVEALRYLLGRGALVIIDDFQRLLDQANGRPLGTLADKYRRIATRAQDHGCLLLISNREVDPGWSEPFYTARIREPVEFEEQVKIVLAGLDACAYEEKFPTDRRHEVMNRLGANPRLLRLLGQLLVTYSLDELLGPQGLGSVGARSSKFTNSIESDLLSKAKEGLSDSARQLLVNLSIFDEPVDIDLVKVMCPDEVDFDIILDELRVRYLIEVHSGLYQLHPTVREFELPRLRRNTEEWRALNRDAGMWFARPLIGVQLFPLEDFKIAFLLSGARYHLLEADAADELEESLKCIGQYIERKYGWEARRPVSSDERDAQINFLRLYLKNPGHHGVEFNFAKLLRSRRSEGDLQEAYKHAELATEGCQFSDPWVLWIQIVRDVKGAEASLKEAQKAIHHVAPDKSLVSVYQLLGANLAHLGRAHEAVKLLLEGAKRIEEATLKKSMSTKPNNKIKARRDCEELLIQEAIFFAAAEEDDALIKLVIKEIEYNLYYGPEKSLANVLLHEHHGDWQAGAELARNARSEHKSYLHLALHEAWCWLAAGQPVIAKRVLDEFGLRATPRAGSIWLAAMLALLDDNLPEASKLLGIYLDGNAPTDKSEIYQSLLFEWDSRIATIGEANPALNFPVLPPIITGSTDVVRRRQYGERVLNVAPCLNHVFQSAASTSLPLSDVPSLHDDASPFGVPNDTADMEYSGASYVPNLEVASRAGFLMLPKPSPNHNEK